MYYSRNGHLVQKYRKMENIGIRVEFHKSYFIVNQYIIKFHGEIISSCPDKKI